MKNHLSAQEIYDTIIVCFPGSRPIYTNRGNTVHNWFLSIIRNQVSDITLDSTEQTLTIVNTKINDNHNSNYAERCVIYDGDIPWVKEGQMDIEGIKFLLNHSHKIGKQTAR